MRSFKDFVLEEMGTMSGPAVAGTGDDKTTVPVRRKPPVVSGPKPLQEDPKPEQKARVEKASKEKTDVPGVPPKEEKKGYHAEFPPGLKEESNLPRDADGKLVTPEREEHGGFWSSHRHPKGELEWFPRKQQITVGGKTWTRTIADTPTPKPKVDKGRTTRGPASEVLGAEQKKAAERKAQEAEEKKKQKQLAALIRTEKQKKELAKLQKQQPSEDGKPSLYDKIKGK